MTTAKTANALYSSGKYREALEQYRDLSQRFDGSLFEANIALCEKRIGEKPGIPLRKRSIVFATDHTFIPHRAGGRESSINDLAEMFVRRGWIVYVVCIRPAKLSEERDHPLFSYQVVEVNDLFIEICGLAAYLNAERVVASVDGRNIGKFLTSFPVGSCLFVRDNQGLSALEAEDRINYSYVANSSFTARQVEEVLGQKVEVFPPFINLDTYRVSSPGEFVAFINPIEKKGLNVALEIAKALPTVRFLFCEGWPLPHEKWVELERVCGQLGNVTLQRHTTDMSQVYSLSKILIVPSQCDEAWGRVVTEAQASGIPAVVNGIGGLRESCGVGGVVMPLEASPQEWAEVIAGIMTDPVRYRELSEMAIRQSERYAQIVSDYGQRFESAISSKTLINIPQRAHAVTFSSALDAWLSGHIKSDEAYNALRFTTRSHSLACNQRHSDFFRLLVACRVYRLAIKVYEENKSDFEIDGDLALALAISYSAIGRHQEAIGCWARLRLSKSGRLTAFQTKTLANSLFAIGRYKAALSTYTDLFACSDKTEFAKSLEAFVESAIRTSNREALNLCEEFLSSSAVVSESKSRLLRTQIKTALGEFKSAFQRIIEGGISSNAGSLEEYSHAIYLALQCGDLVEALNLSRSAQVRFPSNFKGFYSPVQKFASERPTELIPGGHAQAHEHKIVCSWPGMLHGNRFMDELREQFEGVGIGFLPIRMPSDGVVGGAEALLIQWPDVIKWRNGGADKESMKKLMIKEVAAVKAWRNSGVRVVWLVHNLMPHDLLEDELDIWKLFFDLLGDQVSCFVSMSQAAEGIIRREIPSLRDKPYRHFYHPPYRVDSFSLSELHKGRADFGIPKGADLIAILGSIKGYKGVERVVESFARNRRANSVLLVAGKIQDPSARAFLEHARENDSRIIIIDRFLDEAELDLLASCSNKLIVPNRVYLNSGALIYAMSVNKPTLALRHPFAEELKGVIECPDLLTLVDDFSDPAAVEFMCSEFGFGLKANAGLPASRAVAAIIG